jgi:transcriptional regulator with XRE-family HTH domain
MRVPFGFTRQQLKIWGMGRDGLSQAEIARRLGVTRQAIHKALGPLNSKVSQALETAANAAKIEINKIYPKKGVLLGYSHETKDKAIVTFSTHHGAHIWYYYTGQCKGCNLNETCKNLILNEAEERGVTLTIDERKKNPAEIARLVFSIILHGVEL